VSRRCRSCLKPFRPEAKWQRLCWPCWRQLNDHTNTDTKENTMTITDIDTIDWEAAHLVAQHLGAHTRNLVAVRDPEAAIKWALEQSAMSLGTARSINYYELAVILGYRPPQLATGGEWGELLQAAKKLTAAVQVKADEETRARDEERRAARAAAEKAAGATAEEDDPDE